MILHLVWALPHPPDGPLRTQMIVVDYAHPIPGWLVYRKTGDGTEHWVPSSALLEAWPTPQAGDRDPMHTAPASTGFLSGDPIAERAARTAEAGL